MNNKKLLAISMIVLAFIILAVIIYFLFVYRFTEDISIFNKKDTSEVLVENTGVLEEIRQIVKKIPRNKGEESVIVTDVKINEANLVKMASSFAERYGSYSNHSDYENISDLKIFMSKKMIAWADSFVKTSREKSDYSDIYEGVITKSISSKIIKINEKTGNAEILVKTQKIESNGSKSNSNVKYEDILIVFIKEGSAWKIDGAYWQ